jgi:hypothetical protein
MLSVAAAGRVLISVRDSGVGLRPEQGERIFEAFFTTKPQGTGMGLSISRTGVFHVLDALVRPDGFVAWASDGVASAEEVSRAGERWFVRRKRLGVGDDAGSRPGVEPPRIILGCHHVRRAAAHPSPLTAVRETRIIEPIRPSISQRKRE